MQRGNAIRLLFRVSHPRNTFSSFPIFIGLFSFFSNFDIRWKFLSAWRLRFPPHPRCLPGFSTHFTLSLHRSSIFAMLSLYFCELSSFSFRRGHCVLSDSRSRCILSSLSLSPFRIRIPSPIYSSKIVHLFESSFSLLLTFLRLRDNYILYVLV